MSEYMANKMDEQIEGGIHAMEEFCDSIDFGDFVLIPQKRHVSDNEIYLHKVIGKLHSNSWVDVPVQSPATETIHDHIGLVISCICCGVDETEVRNYRVIDTRPNQTGAKSVVEYNDIK